ncbi:MULTISPECIES: inverse autotransporter beta domain-containing protein [unclassified Citrobacter]|uniref:inverse autotransporter beta domain-containing protein n=1 Tax=unclassified Citrobacter TaxID=2644389 RepID=UPI00129A3501|nr:MULTISPECIES: inverse autotransporter beta domain-containing protein [unclassified Citrobacter]
MIERIVWLCLIITTPVLAAITTAPQSSPWQNELLARPSVVYVLQSGETTTSIAERLGLTTTQLHYFNQFRTFNKPFAQLSPGDEIDIPSSSSSEWKTKETAHSLDERQDREAGAKRLAGGATGLAKVLENGDVAEAANGLVRAEINRQANDTVNDWLGKLGTVKTQLSVDEEFSLDESSIDWLVPLHETTNNILFTQLGYRNQDQRNTVNAGVGVRHFSGDWMLGFNTFYDADLTGNNRRLGVGTELWRDYFQLSGNGYLRLSDWQSSDDVKDYDERPANGFDVRLQGWLPQYPHFGGKFIYEHYFGDEVGLTSEDERERNAWAFTTGVTWTPFPLMTLGIEQSLEKGDESNTRVQMGLAWRLGESLKSQISPDEVASLRELKGSRYSLVERNNVIILEYREQDLLQLALSEEAIHDAEYTVHTVSATVSGKYPLSQITWDNAAFLAAGGEFRALSVNLFSMTLPPYQHTQSTDGVANQYRLVAQAQDSEGHTSNTQTLLIDVLPVNLAFDDELRVAGNGAPADGKTPVTITATLVDDVGKPVSGKTINMGMTFADGSKTAEDIVSNAAGQAIYHVVSSVAGPAKATARVSDLIQSADVLFSPVAADGTRSSLLVSPAVIRADGYDVADITFKAYSSQGEPASGLEDIAFQVIGVDNTTTGKVREISPGVYHARMSGINAGKGLVQVVQGNVPTKTQRRPVTLTATGNPVDPAQSTLSATPQQISANGNAESLLMLRLTDSSGNPLKEKNVRFSTTLAGTTISDVTNREDGTYVATLTGTTTGKAEIVTHVNGVVTTIEPRVVKLIPDDNAASVETLMVVDDHAVADGEDENIIKVTVLNADGTPAVGEIVRLYADNDAEIPQSATTDAHGEATIALTSKVAGQATVVAEINGNTEKVETNFTVDSGSLDPERSRTGAVPERIEANGNAESVIYFVLLDQQGNPVPGQKVTFKSTLEGTTLSPVSDNNNGTYKASLSGVNAGVAQITVSVNDNPFPVSAVGITLTPQTGAAGHGETTAITDNALANGTAANRVKVKISTADGEPATAQAVRFVATNGASVPTSVMTDNQGEAIATVSSRIAGKSVVSAMFNGHVQQVELTFLADASSASIFPGELRVIADNALANGVAENVVSATVRDAFGNPLAGQSVKFNASHGAIASAEGVTDEKGTVIARFTNTTAGRSEVLATVNGQGQHVAIAFSPFVSSVNVLRGGQILTGHPQVGDRLSAVVMCGEGACEEQPSRFQWQVETAVGSNQFTAIAQATDREYVVSREWQKRALRVETQETR